jgi:hypothetical protein
LDLDTPLDSRRRVAAWLTIVLFLVTFIPVPIAPAAQPEAPSSQVYDVVHRLPIHHAHRLSL